MNRSSLSASRTRSSTFRFTAPSRPYPAGVIRVICSLALSIVISLNASGSATAQAPTRKSEVIERVVAVVNGEIVLLSDLRQRAAPFLTRIMQAPDEQRGGLMRQLYDQVIGQLVDEHLIKQLATRLQIQIQRADVERAIDNVRGQSGLEDAQFWEAVSEQGFTPERYRADVRRQLLRMRVINQQVRARVDVTEEDIKSEYEAMVRRARRTARFRVAHLFFPVAEASATLVAAARRKAEAAHLGLTPVGFAQAIETHGGGELGWLEQGDLAAVFEDVLLDLAPGELSAPVRGPSGFHIFLLEEREQMAASIEPYAQMRDRLFRERVESAMARQEKSFLENLRKNALIKRKI